MLDRKRPEPGMEATASSVDAPSLWLRLRGMLRRFIFRARLTVARRFSSSLTRRIAILNLAGLAALFLGFLWMNQTRLGVIDARSQSLSLQAELIAGAVAGALTTENDNGAFDPDKFLQQQLNEGLAREQPAAPWFEFSINPARAAPILKRLVAPTRTRARIFDTDGFLLLDTRAFYAPGTLGDATPEPGASDEEQTLFSRTWNAVKQRFGRVDISPPEEAPGPRQFLEVQRGLQGRASSVVRVSTDGQTLVYAAAPIQHAGHVRGVLLLSTQEGDVDRIIAEERSDFVTVFLIAAVVMLLLSAMLAGTIAEPVRKLSEAADRVRRGIRARHEIPDFSDRSDEIGQLSLSLREMTNVLYHRIDAIERFAADVSHELKNPLTSLRSAVETLPLARNPESRERLLAVILHDVKRLDRLITDISDASRLDAELQRSEAEPVDIGALLRTHVDMRQEVANEGQNRVELVLVPEERPVRGLMVRGHDNRLVQVFDNLIENAISFSPPGGLVTVTARRQSGRVEVMVEDEGPGIPDHALERIFERFYTDRPDQGFGQHSGLGLAISRQIVEAHGGTLRAENRPGTEGAGGGARFIVTLPAFTGGR
ncbi:MAG: stimulus-sensing domain-containing protein [Methylobacterium sp.]|nr:stimulus-sensing domain-containing protein [Methylobacterium sp.]MCA3599369.1 stimulus-sensing domain-containing protein [Methylobacterium sp.]MCA3606531.1 stimulus-sensing domain-containing protein [Methylobacterium sp.]MCA3608446.1 stimulus-sensing domain-containing protein [Methylobacterium sp.]MCA3617817.1 stimulus-sensing domain-containing protein [Methylobacterium sp.]